MTKWPPKKKRGGGGDGKKKATIKPCHPSTFGKGRLRERAALWFARVHRLLLHVQHFAFGAFLLVSIFCSHSRQ